MVCWAALVSLFGSENFFDCPHESDANAATNVSAITRQRNLMRPQSLCSENVVVKAVIVPELELSDIQMKVLFADIVEGAHDAAL